MDGWIGGESKIYVYTPIYSTLNYFSSYVSVCFIKQTVLLYRHEQAVI